ncbi:non-ribosomal peptide synthetase [Acidisphaera sp. S103]|uniref:non-ribosomal peptide synthetase n=1 Tax=Acidisphaera sp. S103 TaxID=1747223 RepID=UPI00131E4F74|nr:non-ribosomal peptide synthetase [Acidisphaera sp. S103]
MSEIYPISPVQRRLWDLGAGEAVADYVVTGVSPEAVLTALDALTARWEILRTRFPVPPGLAVPVQDVGTGPSWTATVTDSGVRLTLPGLAMDRHGFALLGQALSAELAGAEPLDGPQYPDVAGWLDDLATGPDGEAGRQFWGRESHPWDAADIPVPPASDSASSATLPSAVTALASYWGTTVDLLLLAAWHLLLQRLSGQSSSRVAVAADGRAQSVLTHALGPLTRWLPGALEVDPALPLSAALPVLAEATEQRRRWQDYTPGDGATFGFRVEPGLVGDRVRLLRCVVPEDPHTLRLVLASDRLAIEGIGADYVMDALLALLAGMAARADTSAGALPIMPEALRARLVVQFNATDRNFPATDAAALFEAACDRDPGAPALRHEGAELSFGSVDVQANAVARRLAAIGVGPESRVGLATARSPALVIGMLGILKAGAAFVPLDPANPPARRDWIAADAGLAAVLHTADLSPPPGVPALLLDGAEDTARPGLRPHPESLAYVLHTSGSTGQPKGVAVTHRGLSNYLLWAGDAYRPELGRGVPVHTSPAFDLTLTALLLPLTRGQWLDLLPESDTLAALAAGFAGVAEWSLVKLTPSHLKALGTEPCAGGTGRLVVGGEALFGEQLTAWAACDPAMPVVNEYGPTETVVGCCVYQAPAGSLPFGPVPIGSPIANTTMLVLDRQGQPVPPGVAGEAWIGGAGVARGYLGRSDLTADRFRPDPAGPAGARAYRTGDLVRHRWDGGLDYLGRADDQLKVAGHRIEPAEIEAALLRLPGVDQVAVLQRGDSLVGFVVPDGPVTAESLRDGLAAILPPWMVPARLRLIPSLPLAPSGKADRAALLALPEATAEHLAPRDAREAALAAIWERVLGRPVGVLDDFFQLGGDSIRGLQVVGRARRIGLSLPPDAVFRHPTVARLAAAVQGVLAAPEAAEDGAWFPLHPIQARFLASAGAEPWHEVQSLLLRPRARPDPAALECALAAVQRRHGMLRARFGQTEDGTWHQHLDPAAEAPRLEVHDVPDGASLERIGTALKRSLDLIHGPLWRVTLLDLADGPALLLAAHHLVIDRVSWGPLLDDLARALAGEALDPSPPAFATWVAALRTAVPAPETMTVSPVTLPLDDPEAPARRLDRTIPAPASQTEVLTALARAIPGWAELPQDTPFAIEVEHHGRDARTLGISIDMSETVGWFTVLAPVPVRGDVDPATVRAALDALPERGLAAMLTPPVAPPPQVLLNHLGRMDLIGGDFESIGRATGSDRSPLRPPSHTIELVTAQIGDVLHCTWHVAGLSLVSAERLAVMFDRHLLALAAPKAVLRRALPAGALEAIEQRLGPVQAVLPATPVQRGMLYHSALDPAGGAYVEQTVMRVDGVLDPAALRAAWTALMRRHAALRTFFSPDEDGDLAQIVLRSAEPAWIDADWRGQPDQNTALASLVAEDRASGFDPQAEPPLRFRLVRLADAEWWFLWTRHHALLDGWSLSPLLTELLALAEGRTLPPPGDPVAASDFLATQDVAADEAFWRGRLKGAEPTPLGGREPATPIRTTSRVDRRVDAAKLLAFARLNGVTPATLVAASWGLVLAHDAGRAESVFAMTSSGRSAGMPGAEQAVGLFLTTLPVRVTLDPDAEPAGFLRGLQAELAAARAHEQYPPEAMLACAALPPGTPLANSLLTYENYPVDPALSAPRPDAPRILAVESAEQSSSPLALLAGMDENEMVLSLRFDPARFDANSATERLDRVTAALDGLTTAHRLAAVLPAPAIGDFENGPAIAHPVETPLHERVLAQASRTPEAPAVLWDNVVISYADLVSRARGVAAALRAAGIRRGDVVGLKTDRCEALLPALLGTLLAGAAWCPLEPDQPPQRLAAMAGDARVRVTLCGPGVTGDGGLPLDATVANVDDRFPALTGDDTAYVLFTSGSTGRPKGVAMPHGAIVNRLDWMQRAYPIGPGDVVLQKTPLGFDVCIWELFWPLLTGASVLVAPPGVQRDPDAMAAVMARHRVSVLHFVPSMLRGFLDTAGIEHRCGDPRLVFTSGEALTPDLVAAWRDRFRTRLHNLYGPTEAAVDVTAWDCGAAETDGTVPIGRPVDNVVTRVLDGAMRRRPAGDLWLGGVQLASGYVNAPAQTADAFRPDPFGPPGARLYRTGDRAAWRADGALLYHGRSDAQVKLRGVRIEIGEIEAALLSHPAVREAAVRLLDDRLIAWVAPGLPADLDGFLADRLPAVMRPSRVIGQPSLPLTASGKLDRRTLTLPDAGLATPSLPRGALESRIATLAAEVLGRRPGPLEDLVALGLHSLGAVRLLNLLRRDLGAAPPLAALHGARTVAGLAAALMGAELRPSPLVRLRGGTGLPLVLVHPIGGDVACFLRLAARLDRPVFAMQARGLLGDAPAAGIDAMARDYCEALSTAVTGPVALAGYSMGCAVAFEMARRLGRQVRTLLLLDGSADRVGPDLPGLAEPEAMLARARADGLVPEGFGRQDVERVVAVMMENQRALSDWRPAPADLSAELIRTQARDGERGWGRLAQGGLRIRDITATHDSLLEEPCLTTLIPLIEAALLDETVPT